MRWLSVAILPLALVAFGSTSLAQAPTEGGAAVTLGHEGIDLYKEKRWKDAYERFAAAERLAHSPVLLLYMARCRREAGDLVAARELFDRVTRESVASDAPAPWAQAKVDAAREVEELAPRIPRVTVNLRGALAASSTVTIDGAPVAANALAAPIPLNPGDHTIEARAGDAVASRSVKLAEGGPPVVIELEPKGAGSAAPTAPRPDAPSAPPAAPRDQGSFVPGAIALGAGAVGLGIGIVTGSMAKSQANEILGRCQGDRCLKSDESNASSAETLATVSTVGFIVGGIGIGAGVALLIVRPGGGSITSSPSAALRIGPARASFAGTF